MKRFMWAGLILIILLGTLTAVGETNKPYRVRLYGIVEDFEWVETYEGQRLVKESGPLFGVGGELALRLSGPLWMEGRGELLTGEVDYDGHITNNKEDLTPYKSDTEYAIIKIEGALAYTISACGETYLQPSLG